VLCHLWYKLIFLGQVYEAGRYVGHCGTLFCVYVGVGGARYMCARAHVQ
jgi:hypothetical protein